MKLGDIQLQILPTVNHIFITISIKIRAVRVYMCVFMFLQLWKLRGVLKTDSKIWKCKGEKCQEFEEAMQSWTTYTDRYQDPLQNPLIKKCSVSISLGYANSSVEYHLDFPSLSTYLIVHLFMKRITLQCRRDKSYISINGVVWTVYSNEKESYLDLYSHFKWK